MEPKPRNDRLNPVTRFCLAMEEARRTEAGRVKSAKELVDHFFPHDAAKAVDRLFVHLPREVRAPIVAGWGIRGAKAALRDDDDRIRGVIHDALLAGDIDPTIFEEGVTPGIVADWAPLGDWWGFWRSGMLSGAPTQRALASARELGLFDDRWFLANLDGRGGRLKGTDTIADTLTKEQIVSWVRAIHASGDGSPAGIVAALGWDVILKKTSQEALLFALDALAKKVGLVQEPAPVVAGPVAAGPLVPVVTGPATSGATVRGSEVPDVAIPDFPMDEHGLDKPVDFDSSAEWPELAAPGDMGHAITRPPATNAAKSSDATDEHSEVTSQHDFSTLLGPDSGR